jgi:Rrf2 family iron-sulfur cluster assembly transcriptional regulator
MKFAMGVDYSLRALLMLAEQYPASQPQRLEVIARSQHIRTTYLRFLLVALRRAGLVLRQKGPGGGYLLAQPPSRITMAGVIETIDGEYSPMVCLEPSTQSACRPDEACAMRPVWREVRPPNNLNPSILTPWKH